MLGTVGLIGALALVLLAAPPAGAAAQPAKVWRVGLFHVGLDHVPPSLDGLREGLRALGYEEGKNIRLDWRNLADEEAARAAAREFVRDQVDLIVAFESQTARAAKTATTNIPIVFLHVTDPVNEGFVKSLAHPGGELERPRGVLRRPPRQAHGTAQRGCPPPPAASRPHRPHRPCVG